MPDSLTVIPADLATTPRARAQAPAAPSRSRSFLNADQMRALWLEALEVEKNWDSDNSKACGQRFDAAVKRIADAHTLDPVGIAYKLLATRQWPEDRRKGLADDLRDKIHEDRSIALIIKDTGVLDHAEGISRRRVPSRLRPLWEAYQKGWKDVCNAMDEEDRAMLARPKGSSRRSTAAEKAADRQRVKADDAFDAAKEALDAAPTRTLDDAICRIEYAIDQIDSMVDSHVIETLNAALRVLRKVYQPAQDCIQEPL